MFSSRASVWAVDNNGWKLQLNFSINDDSLPTYEVELKGEENWHTWELVQDFENNKKVIVHVYWLDHKPQELNFVYNDKEYVLNHFEQENDRTFTTSIIVRKPEPNIKY
jgi:hypothetical protein